MDYSLFMSSDGNLLIVYKASNTLFDSNIQSINVIAKIEESSGKTLWAKAFLTEYQMINMNAADCTVADDNIWMAIRAERLGSYFGGFIRFDTNGNMNLLKIFSASQQSSEAAFLQPISITSFLNSSVVMNGAVANSVSTIGYSNISSFDEAVFKIDQNGDVSWITVLDYDNGYDFTFGLTSYESFIYAGFYGDNLYP